MDNFFQNRLSSKSQFVDSFLIDFDLLDKLNIALADFWDEVLEHIKAPLLENGRQLLNGSETHINDDYSLISYHVVLFVQPPIVSIDDLIISLSKLSYPKKIHYQNQQ